MNLHVASGEAKAAQSTAAISTPVLIIGCGFGGIALAIALEQAGLTSFIILERASDVGGVWRDNSYPGAACDVVSRLYSFSYDQDYPWSTAFAPRDEIFTYIKRCVERHRIREHVRFEREVASAAFDAQAGTWTVTTVGGDRFVTPVLVSAVGLFNNPSIPDIAGRDQFKGTQFHSARWDHASTFAGKPVAVIGNGASAVQFIPKIAREVAQLHLFQRSPQYVMPKSIFPGTGAWDHWLQKHPRLRGVARLKIFLMFERFIWRRRWRPHLRLNAEAAFRKLLETKIKDPVLRQKLTPNYPMGCKRQLVSDEWYDALVRPNVEVVDTAIERIEPDGIRTRDGNVRRVDAIIYGTGFTPTAFLTPMRITGLGGRDLNEAWRDGAEAYLGLTVTGFPNFFMMYGPNTNAVASIIYMLECQARYIVSAVRTLSRRGARFMNVHADTQRRFNEEAQARLATTIPARPDCFTYFKQPNGRITTQWPGYALEYRIRTHAVRSGDYEFV
ncbi:MAG TPA: NAD(P)/FAD-dependent oxidoreductase [Xanthobacteraceae bacterium]